MRAPLGPATLEGQLAERKLSLGQGCQAREIRFWIDRRLRGTGKGGQPRKPLQLVGKPAHHQRQPALVTTHPYLSAEQAAGLLRSRWTQENYFKYQRAEFGLDTLPEHALVAVDDEAWVVNPAWRQIDKALKNERNIVGNLRRKRALESDPAGAGAHELDARIQACDRTIEGLVKARQTADHHVQAGQLSQAERLQALPAPLRLLMDTLRMIAYRAETAMATAVGPKLDNPDTARSLLKALFRCDASLHPDEQAGTLTVRLLHPADPRPGPRSGPLARRAEPHANRIPRHLAASGVQDASGRRILSNPIPASPRSPPSPLFPARKRAETF